MDIAHSQQDQHDHGDKPLDIAILVHDLRPSGVVANAIRIAEASRRAGLAAELWTMNDGGPRACPRPETVRTRVLLPVSAHLPRALGSLAGVPSLAARLRHQRPRILLSAGNHIHAQSLLAHRLAGLRETLLVGRVSNALAAAAPCKRPGPGGRLARTMAIGLERLQFRAMDRIIAVSDEIAAQLATHGGVDPGAITVIPNGVDLDAIGRAARERLDHPWFAAGAPPVIVAAGRLCRQKNFEQLIAAFGRVRTGIEARLVILGDGAPGERERLLAAAREARVADDLWLAGHQENPFRFFARARLFAQTSRWEGCSNVLIEALACGLPAVVTDHPGGMRTLLDGMPAARVVPVGDVQATADALRQMLDRPAAPELSRAAVAGQSLAACLARYQATIRSALAQRPGAEPTSSALPALP